MPKKKIKILRIINRFNIGGPTYNATFLTRFISDDFETLLIGGAPEKDEKDSLYILDKYEVEPTIIKSLQRNPNLISDLRAYKEVKEIIKSYKPDIVHTHASKAGAIGRKAAKACGVPVIIHTFHGHIFHSYFGKIKTAIFKNIERKLAKKSTKILAISPIQKTELTKEHAICPAHKVEVIPLGFDLEQFQTSNTLKRKETRKRFEIKDNEIAIAIIGRLAPIKNHQFFLKVVQQLLTQTKKEVKIFIVGDGEERQTIEKQSEILNKRFGNRIVLTSWIKDIATFNAGMDIICLTSDNEGTPVSLIEAQATNIPVISTDVGGVRDIVKNNTTGFIVKKGDIETYTEKLRLLVEDDKLRRSFSKAGYNHVKNQFHYTALVDKMEKLYKKTLTNVSI
ncbi:MAG: glycosyltransferase [Lishizhenia sp.]